MRECVGAIVIQHEAVLLGKRSANRTVYPKVWDVFGGHVESGESRRQALERELAEELGIVLTDAHYLETLRIPGSTESDDIECHLYVVTEWRGTPTESTAAGTLGNKMVPTRRDVALRTGRYAVRSYHGRRLATRKKNQYGNMRASAIFTAAQQKKDCCRAQR